MNLLEQYIKEIISEEKIQRDGKDYCKVKMICDCYGTEDERTLIFSLGEWNKIKKQGYYMG